ncbi:MAG: carbonic anhydrase [Fimbriimonas sp.]
MEELVHGVAAFHQRSDEVRPLMQRLAEKGQEPKALLLTCVDARLDPAMLMGAKPGDLLVHRNVGALVPRPDVGDGSLGAAVEFALDVLQIPNIIVMGHSHCGAMAAALEAEHPYGPLSRWLDHTEPARRRFTHGDVMDPTLPVNDQLSQVNVLQSLDHLRTYSLVRKRLEQNAVTLHGWWFHLPTCVVSAYDPSADRFLPVETVYE